MDTAELTSYIGLILMPVLSYFAVSNETSNMVIGVVAGIVALIFQYYNEKYNSNVISGEETTNNSIDD